LQGEIHEREPKAIHSRAPQFRKLLAAAGLRLDRVIEMASTLQVIEASAVS
jgi:hypothetical protein